MKKMLPLALAGSLAISIFNPDPASSYTVYCTNCSNTMIQALERATSLEQLTTMSNTYSEAVQQTATQLQSLQTQINQYMNMLKNTAQLPQNLVGQVKSDLTRLAQITTGLNTKRSDIDALGQVFDQIYLSQNALHDIVNSPRGQVEGNLQEYRRAWNNMAQRVDESTRATFQLSGSQLKQLEESGELENYVNQLLQTPEGQQQAIMAGNQLTALQIQEARQLRELIATKTQSEIASQTKEQKEKEIQEEYLRKMGESTFSKKAKEEPLY